MRTLRLSLVGTVILALLGGLGSAVIAQDEAAEPMAFPTGTFLSVENDYVMLELNEDGTGIAHDIQGGWAVPFIYAIHGDLFTEMAHEASDLQVPATYHWDFDGEHLTMEPWGEVLLWHRNFMYAENTWRPVEDPRVAAYASMDIEAGSPLVAWGVAVGFRPGAEVGPDAYATLDDVVNRVAAVPITKGQPITPDMLESMSE